MLYGTSYRFTLLMKNGILHVMPAAGIDIQHSIVRTCSMVEVEVEVVSRLVGQLHDFIFN
jgi:hypothetical protein